MKKTNNIFQNIDKEKLNKMLAIKQAHSEGKLTTEAAREKMQNEVGKVTPEEFAAAEQLLKDETPDECRNEDVSTMLDIFEGLIPETELQLPYGHPIDAYRRENTILKKILQRGDAMLKEKMIPNQWHELIDDMMGYKLHWQRKQNQLYSALEKKGFDRPSTTMWTYDDYIKDELNAAKKHLETAAYDTFTETYQTLAADLRDLMEKEEYILFPTSLKLISENEFETMKKGDREIGFFKIDMPPYQETQPYEQRTIAPNANLMEDLTELLAKHGLNQQTNHAAKVLDVAEGKLTLQQINLLFQHMPVDISYVDENELVAFYTDTPHRVFPRSKGVIGREVKKCHPPKSVHLVEEIVEKFRSGEKDTIDFWINKPDLFIYIKYVAVRDSNGTFRGVMEMMQDCTRIRNLQGSRTLLTWDEEEKKEHADDKKEDKEIISRLEPCSEIEDKISLTAETKLADLIKHYPRLKNDMVKINSQFKMLQTPIAKVILPKATLKMIAERSNMSLNTLILKLQEQIKLYEK